jgi:outer membrane protein assembly factor BamB
MQSRKLVVLMLLAAIGGAASCRDSPLAGVDGQTTGPGGIVWHVPTPQPPALSGTIAADDSNAFYYATGRRFAALRLRDQRVLWTATGDESSDDINAMHGVELCAGNVVFGTAGAAYAFVPKTGERRWRWRPSQGGLLIYAGPACADNTIVFATGKPMRVYGVDAHTGVELWNTPFGDGVGGEGFLTTPAIADGVAVTCSREFALPFRGAISAFSMTTGAVLWRFTWVPPQSLVGASCSEAVRAKDGIVAASVDDGRVFGLALLTGALRWTAPPVALFATLSDERSVAIVDSTVILGSLSGRLIAHDLRTGTLRWNIADSRSALSIFNYGLIGGNGEVYGVNLSGWIASYDVATGKRRWALAKGVPLNERVFLAEGVALTPTLAIGRANDGIYAIRR